jgi:hypothetical protein
MRLGDCFPKEIRLDLVRRQLQPGQVLYWYCEFTHPHKDKFLVVAYAAPILGLLVINSEIPEYIQKRSPKLLSQNAEIILRKAPVRLEEFDKHLPLNQVMIKL